MTSRDQVEARRARVEELSEAGLPQAAIAEQLGVSLSVVRWDRLMLGLPAMTPAGEPRTYQRGGRLVRPFSRAEDELLIAMSNGGCTYADMARALGRRAETCRALLYTLARRMEVA